MLQDIKSVYFINILFSYIDEGQKLKLIKYNKSLQKILNISITYYIFFSEKYIIYESNIYGKEYLNKDDRLIYEGGFLNGKRNGKGKEYNKNGNLSFEGEYLNGKRHGKGKEYDDGVLKYESEYFNGKRNGKGKEYNINNTIKFEGEYLNGKPNFKGKQY